MKITKRVLSILLPGVAVASLLVACSDDDSGSGSNTGNDQGAAGAPTVIVNTGYECPEPGESFCNGSASGVVCAKGSTNGVPFACAQGEVCEEGACVGQCEAGATECVGEHAFRTCSADGKQWVPVACQPGEACVDGACERTGVEVVCTAGEKKCDGSTVQTCKNDGSGWDEVECPSGTECTDGGACAGVCTVGETRCDGSTLDLAQQIFGNFGPFSGGDANYGVVWKCVDGTGWELEPCATGEFCTYDGIDAAEVARYKNDLYAFGMSLIFAEGSAPVIPAFPKPPAIPAGAKASCTVDACGLDSEEPFFYADGPFSFFESTGVRECGAPGDGEEDSPYAKMSQCTGLPPYEAFQVTTVECPGETMCAPGYPERGCAIPQCVPGETYCDGDSVVSCDEYWLEGSWQYCGDGCTETGTAPNRTATCNPAPEPPV